VAEDVTSEKARKETHERAGEHFVAKKGGIKRFFQDWGVRGKKENNRLSKRKRVHCPLIPEICERDCYPSS